MECLQRTADLHSPIICYRLRTSPFLLVHLQHLALKSTPSKNLVLIDVWVWYALQCEVA